MLYTVNTETDDEEITDEICDFEEQFEDEYHNDDNYRTGKYHIGTYQYIESENILLFNTRITDCP